jgi:hypothetical protein
MGRGAFRQAALESARFRAKLLKLNEFLSDEKDRSRQRQARRINHLARNTAAFPQSYPQKPAAVEKTLPIMNLRLVVHVEPQIRSGA